MHAGIEFAPFAYDAVWAVALALHGVAQQLAAENSSVKLEDFVYDNTNHLRERFVAEMSNLAFEGITVRHVVFHGRAVHLAHRLIIAES